MTSPDDPDRKRFNSTLRSMSKKKMAGVFTTDQLLTQAEHYFKGNFILREVSFSDNALHPCRRVDLLLVKHSRIVAVEIKASRGDLLRDMKNPEKQQWIRDKGIEVWWFVGQAVWSEDDEYPPEDRVYVMSAWGQGHRTTRQQDNSCVPIKPFDTDFYPSLMHAVLSAAARRGIKDFWQPI